MFRSSARRAFLGVVLVLGLVSCDDEPQNATAGTPAVEIRGTVVSAQTADAVAAVDGRVAEIRVNEGATVRAGDLVATLKNAAIDRDLAFARAQLAVAEQRLHDAQTPVRAPMTGDARARERAAAEILKNREARRARYRDLYRTHDVSKQELEDAENDYAAAMRDWLAERERSSTRVAQQDTDILQLEIEKARADLALAADRQSLLEVKAPMNGVVTRVATRAGDSVFPRDTIAEIANTNTVEVRGPMAPELAPYVRAGMPVEVKIFTVPPRRVSAPVRAVVPGPGGATVVVEVPNPDGMLHAGQNALITVR